ncbi:MAG: type IV pilus modification protein PilV, partial [Chloroflexota bacterium]|nr:type IV pilus modification protein PilV [Chloroflexota bacterium]
MTRNLLHRRDGGFSLIEVMVAVAVLAFGLMALAALQSTLIRASAETKAQSVGLAMAKDAVEQMRSYQAIAGYQAIDTRTEANAEQMSVGGVNYRRWWTVTRYAYNPTLNTFVNVAANTGATPTGFDSNNEFKRIQVNVAWTDATGATRSTSIEDALAALDPADSAKLARLGAGMTPRKPKVIIWNPSNTEGVIPIAIGGGSETAATNPTPEVAGRNAGNARVIETRFDILTYAALSGNRALAQARVETVVAGCQCDAVATAEQGFRPTYWDGERYVVPQRVSNNAPARAATNLSVAQSPQCTICCRDHHDPASAVGPKFSPFIATHPHFAPDAVNVTTTGMDTTLSTSTPVAVNPVTSGRYAEACRNIRVDGIFRVAADAYASRVDLLQTNTNVSGQIQGLPTLPAATASAPIQSTYNYAGPMGFVLSYMKGRFVDPSSTTTVATYNNQSLGITPTAGSLHPNEIQIGKSETISRWGHLRGLYIDYLEPVAVARLNAAKVSCAAANAAQAGSCDQSTKVLSMLPFTSVNLTELGEWRAFRQTQSGNNNNISFAAPYYEDDNYDHLFTANNDFLTSF